VHVEDRDVRLLGCGDGDCLPGVGRGGDERQRRFAADDRSEDLAQEPVVVGDEDPDLGGWCLDRWSVVAMKGRPAASATGPPAPPRRRRLFPATPIGATEGYPILKP
jgi:hypothetical protein